MVELSREIVKVIVLEYSQEELLRRISNPYWFQGFGCVLGFDWHSSGLTTTTCGALKEALKDNDLGIYVCGGKGKTSRRTLSEIEKSTLRDSKIEELKRASRLSAKVDSSMVQDSYQLYHHTFIFTEKGEWTVVQQGMNPDTRYARRYHWLSMNLKEFVEEPHTAICCDQKSETLDLTSSLSRETRSVSLDLVRDDPEHLRKYLGKNLLRFTMPRRHRILDVDISERGFRILKMAHEYQPQDYEELVSIPGIGPKTLRALALISDLIYGAKPSWEDPVKYSYAHGGKDGIPYPVNKSLYDRSIKFLREVVEQAEMGKKEKMNALRRLSDYASL